LTQSLPRRIFGIETEYGITCSLDGHRRLTPDEIARYLFKDLVNRYRSNNVFLPNGGRLYLDVGSHPEYATAECDLLADVVAQELAGDFLIAQMARDAEVLLRNEGVTGRIYIFKNNTDSVGNSYGCHENYLIHRKPDQLSGLDGLLPFLVTRQIFLGAGKLLKTSTGTKYVLSQRAEHLWDSVSSATTRSRPLINTRDEPHADSDRYRRLHVISADSNMSQTAMLLKVATMDLILAAMEVGAIPVDLRIENPMRSIREISRDLTGGALVGLSDGRQFRAYEIQRWYLDVVQSCIARFDWQLSQWHKYAIKVWSQILEAFENADLTALDRIVDWRIKQGIIDAYATEQNLSLDSPKLAQIDFMYHEIGSGIAQVLTEQNRTDSIIDQSLVASAVKLPPQSTRAKLRGEFIAQAEKSNLSVAIDWMHLKINQPVEQSLTLSDPFANIDSRVSELLELAL